METQAENELDVFNSLAMVHTQVGAVLNGISSVMTEWTQTPPMIQTTGPKQR